MNILVTGGSGVVGNATISALVRRGHSVRLFSRGAADDVEAWPSSVEARPGNVAEAGTVRGAADGCDAIIHIVGVISESPPHVTFDRVNVAGTRHIVEEANRAGVRRLVYISSLGAERGESDYHRSKLAAEQEVRAFTGEWVIVRLGNVYGPGDEVLSMLLRMVRVLPAIPVIAGGEQRFQPIWHEDAGEALALAAEQPGLAGEILELAGPEQTTVQDVLDSFGRITGREPVRVPLPQQLVELGAKAAEKAGIDFPLKPSQLTMLDEENVIEDAAHNALTHRFGITPKPLEEGLLALADAQPEQTPEEGIGKLKYRVVAVEITGSRYSAADLFERFRAAFGDFVPIETEAEPGTDDALEEGATITMSLPLRGNIQVRVTELTDTTITLATLEGHPLAGAVRFRFEDTDAGVRFTVSVADRPATRLDYLSMLLGGNLAQRSAWIRTAERVLEESGGEAPHGVKHSVRDLDDDQAEPIEEWLDDLINSRKRGEAEEEGR